MSHWIFRDDCGLFEEMMGSFADEVDEFLQFLIYIILEFSFPQFDYHLNELDVKSRFNLTLNNEGSLI